MTRLDKTCARPDSFRSDGPFHPSASKVAGTGLPLRPVALACLLALAHGIALAGTGSCTGAGAISVSDARVGECGLDSGDTLSITSGGSITGDGVGASVGVRVGAGVTGVQVINEGSIVGNPSDGLWNQGSIVRITNRGQLQSSGVFALGVYNLGTIGELNNESSGVISGSGGQPDAIESLGALSTLNNAGQILGGIRTSNTSINLLGSSARITGAVLNAGASSSVTVSSGAVFTTENTFESSTFRVRSGARLVVGDTAHTISAYGLVPDAFLNEGTLHVPEGVQATITGNYTQSGTLRVGASSAASFGRLTVTGDATLTSSARFDVDVGVASTLAAGETLAGVMTAGGTLTNGAPAGNVSDNSALFNFRSVTNGNAVDLQVLAAGSSPSPSPSPSPLPVPDPAPGTGGSQEGIVPAVIQSGLVNGVPAARVLDGYVRGGRTGTDWDTVVTALGLLPDNPSVARAVGQLMPSMHGNAALALMAHGAGTGAAVAQQQALATLSSGDQVPGFGLWVKPLGAWIEQDRFRQVSGYQVRTVGLVGGMQTELAPGSMLGFGLAYLDGRIDGKDFALGHRSDLESLQLIGYGAYELSGWRLQWQADATRTSVKSRRWLGFIERTALGSYHGNGWHLGVNLGKPMVMEAATVTPSIGVDWRQLRSGAYRETGAAALDLSVGAQKARELVVKVGVQTLYPVGAATHLMAQAALGYDLASGSNATTARFTGGGPVFLTEGMPRRRGVVELGLGVRHRPGDELEFNLRYDLLLREGLTDQGASLRLDWRF